MMHRILSALAAALAISACASVPIVPALRETAPVSAIGDAADDPAIWVAPAPDQSLVIATQKQGGIYVFDLSGAIVQEAPGGRPNNIDLREGFPWREGAAPIVGASDRSDNAIVLWRLDAAVGRLDPTPRARIATGFAEVYGFCLGRSGEGFIAVATDKNTGEVGVWALQVSGEGDIAGERVASFTLGSITEGCVIDEDHGALYLAQELVGIWRVDLTGGAAQRRLIDRVGAGRLVADVEGLTLWRGEGGAGYLIASVQGASRYAVYERGGANLYRGAFRIGASRDGRADAVTGTDGIDATSAALAPDMAQGLLVAQDNENTGPDALQNFKYVSWAQIAEALGLEPNPVSR